MYSTNVDLRSGSGLSVEQLFKQSWTQFSSSTQEVLIQNVFIRFQKKGFGCSGLIGGTRGWRLWTALWGVFLLREATLLSHNRKLQHAPTGTSKATPSPPFTLRQQTRGDASPQLSEGQSSDVSGRLRPPQFPPLETLENKRLPQILDADSIWLEWSAEESNFWWITILIYSDEWMIN